MIGKVSILFFVWYLLSANTTFAFTRSDTLRGSDGRGRSWWNVLHYTLAVDIDTVKKCINGTNTIRFEITGKPSDSLQIDLQQPLNIESVMLLEDSIGRNDDTVYYTNLMPVRDGNVFWITYPFHKWAAGTIHSIHISYKGAPREAIRPPWDGGFSWGADSMGQPWVAVSCQGLGASSWWPCKDAQWDEPDSGMLVRFRFAERSSNLISRSSAAAIVTSGRPASGGFNRISNPINNYDVTFYGGNYVHWHDTLHGEMGLLDLDFYVLNYHEAAAREHFRMVKSMLHCFEYWMGPYPFYSDGFKLVEAPYLGMEHQGAIAYGNNYKMGYKGTDRSGTGIGMNFDYIIVHETGHEWFGNNVTAKDIADNWIQEGITTYSESLYEECLTTKQNGQQFCKGEWKNIDNDKPLIGPYGVNEEGSNDIYDKGAAIMHMIRVMTNNDAKFRKMLRGLGKQFYHSTVTTQQVEAYIADNTGLQLRPFFNQYLRQARIPELDYYIKGKKLFYRWEQVVPDFELDLIVSAAGMERKIHVTADWQSIDWKGGYNITFSKDMLYTLKNK